MGNDEYLLWEGQYVYSENLDIYRDPRCIQLAGKPTLFLSGLPDLASIMLTLSTLWPPTTDRKTVFALENKDIVDAVWDLRYPGSTLRPLDQNYGRWRAAGILSGGHNVFLDWQSGIIIPQQVYPPASWALQWSRDSDAKDWTNKAAVMDTLWLLYNGETKPILKIGNDTFIADNQDIYSITYQWLSAGMPWYVSGHKWWPWYPWLKSFPQWISQPGENIFLSNHIDSVWSISSAYYQVESELSSLSLGAWAPGAWTKQGQVYRNSKFLHWINKNGVDIIVGWAEKSRTYPVYYFIPDVIDFESVFTYMNLGFWADSQVLIAKSRRYSNVQKTFWNHGITYYLSGLHGLADYNWAKIHDMVYCVSFRDDFACVYAYGKNIWGMRDAWSVVLSRNSQGKKMKRIGCLYRQPYKNWFYYTFEDEDGVFWVDYFDDITLSVSSYQSDGKIFLRTDDGGDLSQKKEVKELKIGVKVPENTSVVVSYIIDGWDEVVYETITKSTQWTSEYKDYRGNKPIRWFHEISWFVKLTGNWTNTPQLYNFNYELWTIQ